MNAAIWRHNCSPIRGAEGWYEHRIEVDPHALSPQPVNLRGAVKMFVARIEHKDHTVWFTRYLFENKRDFLDFRIRQATAAISSGNVDEP